MAEFAGSIIGIVSAGAKVTLVLSQLAADVGSAGKEARMIGSEIRSFCAVIKTLGDTLSKIQTSQYYKHCADLIEPMTETSMEMFTEILNASENLRGVVKGKDGKDGKFGFVGRVHWAIFQKPKIMVLRAAIEAYKSNLALMLATLSTAEKVARLSPTDVLSDLVCEEEKDRSLLQSLELEHRASMIELEEVEQQYRMSTAGVFKDAASPKLDGAPPAYEDDTTTRKSLMRDLPWMGGLMESARKEIHSVRSSISGASVFDVDQIQSQVARQSARLSLLMAEDQHRISQRWSAIISLSSGSSSHLRAIGSSVSSTQRKEVEIPSRLPSPARAKHTRVASTPLSTNAKAETPVYLSYHEVLAWLKQRSPEARTIILTTLKRDASDPPLGLSSSSYQPIRKPSTSQEHVRDRDQGFCLQEIKSKSNGLTYKSEVKEILKLVQNQLRNQALLPHGSPTVNLSELKLTWLDESVVDAMISSISKLALCRNQLSGLPDNFSLCHSIRYLDLSDNKLSSLPTQILNFQMLENLYLDDNKLQVLPKNISGLISLRVLSIGGNKIRGLPLAIGDMSNLVLLKYHNNPIEFPSTEALEAFIPNRYAPTPQHRDEEEFQNTKRLKAFLKMTCKLSPSAERAIENTSEPAPTTNGYDNASSRSREDSTAHLQTPNVYDSPGFASEVPTISFAEPALSQLFPAFKTQAQRAETTQPPTPKMPPTHRKSRSHDVTSKTRAGLLSAKTTLPRRNSFNSSLPAFDLADILHEEESVPATPPM